MAKPTQCAHCTKPATIHLTQIVDNEIHKVDMCEACAYKQGLTDPEGLSFDALMSDEKPQEALEAEEAVSSDKAQMTFEDFKKTGRFSSPDCYETFKDRLRPLLKKMHYGVRHRGKVPQDWVATQELTQLRESLTEAIEQEQYEEAALIRDKIEDLKEKKSV